MRSPDVLSATAALGLGLVSTAVLVALHLAAPHIRRLPLVPERVTGSFAGGIAVAYVFLHLLPELAEGHTRLREVFGEESAPSPLAELGIFLVALAGFATFYLLEHAATTRRKQAGGAERGGHRLFLVHLASYAVYNAVITYTLPLTYRTGIGFAVLFTVAMGLHFVLSDRGLHEHYGEWFDRRWARLLLSGALLVGWGLAAVFAPTSSLTVSILVAFLAGSVLLNVFKEEVPAAGKSSVGWFTTGLAVYALLLGLITALGEREDGTERTSSAHPTRLVLASDR